MPLRWRGGSNPPSRTKLMNSKISDAQVKRIAKISWSVADCMKRLGLTEHGYAHARFTQRLKNLGVTIKYDRTKIHTATNKRRETKEYFTLNGPIIPSSTLRLRLIRDGYKKAQCEWCKRVTWRSQPIPLHLDHVNGNKRDCRRRNLRILCPNCHSQTKTHSKRKS